MNPQESALTTFSRYYSVLPPLEVPVDLLRHEVPHWFAGPARNFAPDLLKEVRRLLQERQVSVWAFIGLWCMDCQKLVPELLDIVGTVFEPVQESRSRLRLILLGKDRTCLPWTEKFGIARLPTFILETPECELGRVVETPKVDLLSDLKTILTSPRKRPPDPAPEARQISPESGLK